MKRVEMAVLLTLCGCLAGIACKKPPPKEGKTNTVTLTVTINPMCVHGNGPAGGGDVFVFPVGGQSCATDRDHPEKTVTCTSTYNAGTTVDMVATVAKGDFNGFEQWSLSLGVTPLGPSCGTQQYCVVTLDANTQATATFCGKIL